MFRTRCCSGWPQLAARHETAATENAPEAPARAGAAGEAHESQGCAPAQPGPPAPQERMVGAERLK